MSKRLLLVIGFAAGALVAGTTVGVLAKKQQRFWQERGELMTKIALMHSLPRVLGDDYRMSDGYQTLFEVKDTAVVIVERNGVKTLRVYMPSEPGGAANPSQPVPSGTNLTSAAAGSGR